ncbi:hypothetical protein CW740_08175 [Kangiella profundi]|uniref:Uncharacterized protein n=1 Tax=Kangiella profundi TaxID=1561924 RepID=A0A2K9ANN2_9GAMM|nr:prolyl oligopeptidase family serine peptidase [Kangiella profundi]AUD79222.1 hypothetical protein CW740_08175 [Kangiella profundi]GGF00414.1 hypothetical protein GCM10011356_12690 [Kangiella profundi]
MIKQLLILIASLSILTGFTNEETQEIVKESSANETLKNIFSPNGQGNYSLSPDGTKVFYYKFDGHKYYYYVQFLESEKEKQFIEVDSPWIVDGMFEINWLDSDDVIAQFVNPTMGLSVFSYTISNQDGEIVIDENLITNDYYVEDPLRHVPNQAIFAKRYDKGGSLIFKANIKQEYFSKQLKPKYRLNRGAEDYTDWLFDKEGEPIVAYQKEDDQVIVSYRKFGKWKELLKSKVGQRLIPVSVSPDEKYLNLILSVQGVNYVRQYSLDDEQFTDYEYQLKTKDISSAQFNQNTGEIISVAHVVDGAHLFEFVQSASKKEYESIKRQLGSKNFYITDQILSGEKSILVTLNSNDPGTFYFFDKTKNEVQFLAYSQPDIKDINFQSARIITSKASDGLEIESYFLPSAHSVQTSPLIVMPHGGPIGVRDYTYYDKYAQALSQLGYNVLQPNYRGSSGFGKDFLVAGQKQWGRMIEEDIHYAKLKAIETFDLAPDNTCIFGISYGGYSALMSAIKYKDDYQCAASFAGVTDLTLLYSEYAFHVDEDLKEFFISYIGNPETEIKDLVEHSPVYQLKNIEIPVFVSQGGNDAIVDMEHYFRLRYVSEQLGKDNIQFRFYPGAKHGLLKVSTTLDYLNELDAFFKKHLNKSSS